ncbi:hypothetical protein CC77DRAFT_279089 [Alternaria alternata]|uniref:C2H2-type domain-containing protein n=1 Tax=Alternaria alternata TaxID=5599 RepID=A0A177DDA6_ALTAL|nr:hypothetical protein CC77DRAFT_279089 [Alternaria alternata]OAG17100.1 hypothetical protein CC77DRAFT_279089 [Alternaria alternata]
MSSYGYVITTSKFTAVNEAMADQLRPTLYPDAALPSRADFPFEQRNRSPSFVPNPISAPERTYSSTTTTKKRSARDRCKDDADLRQSRRRRLSKEPLPDASLACPFAKHNPITSPGCWNFAAENLARLKEHLLRRHERRPYCPICLGQFDSDTLRDIHVRERTCLKVNGEQIGAWMDPKAAQRIRQRTKKSENAKEGWQRMYSVIFPDDETIHSPCEWLTFAAP